MKANEDLTHLHNETEKKKQQVYDDVSKFSEKHQLQHEVNMKVLSNKKIDLENKLKDMEKRNKEERIELRAKSEIIESNLAAYKQQCELELNKKDNEIKEMEQLYEKELEEVIKLEKYFNLIDHNTQICKEEEEILACVKRKEEEALKMLSVGAVQLQKLFRGKKDRAIVARMKSKKAKRGKSKKKKGKKKNKS